MHDWTCDCGEKECEQCGESWAKKEPEKTVVKDYGNVRLMSDDTYEVDF